MRELRYLSLFLTLLPALAARAETINLMTHDFPPYSFSDTARNQIVGITTDEVLEIFRRGNQDYRLTLTSWARAYQTLQSDTLSCTFPAFRTPEREKLFNWVGPLSRDSWVFFGRAGSARKMKSQDDFKPYVIGSFKSSGSGMALAAQGFKVEFANGNQDNLRLLINGRIDYWLTAEILGEHLIQKYGYSDQIVKVFNLKQSDLYMACNLKIDKQRVERFDEILQDLEKDGTAEQIYQRYITR